ncbi:MAG TPA: PAS domain S-box protein [Pirellulales bacterium]|jgi:PAS domain S-box-containing protein|nr:PAS domain S-box protein [Pirellulales bacterium]
MSMAAPDRTAPELLPAEPETLVARVRLPLAVKLAVYTALIVVITSAALSLAVYNDAREALKSGVRARLKQAAASHRDLLLDYLEGQRQLGLMVARRTFLRSLVEKYLAGEDSDFVTTSQRLLADSQEATAPEQGGGPTFLEISIADLEGRIITSTASQLVGQSVADKPEFLNGREKSYLASSHADQTIRLHLSTKMVDDSGQLMAMLLVLLDVRPVAAMLEGDSGLGKTGELLVASREGDGAIYLQTPHGELRGTIPLAESRVLAMSLYGKEDFKTSHYQGKSVLMLYMPIDLDHDGPDDWGLIAKIDSDEAFAPIDQFRNMFFALQAGLIVGGIACSYAVARRLTKPIRQLTQQSTRAAGGELSVRVPTDGLDELSVLATAFNSMIERLGESRELLETRVLDRTRALARTNAELAQEIVIRRAAEEALHAGQRRIRATLEAAHEAFIGIDRDSIITDWNHQAEFTFGWSREEAVGHALPELILPERFRESHRQGVRQFLETGYGPVLNQRLELIALHRAGHEFPVEVTVSAVRAGGDYFFCAFLHDITQRKEAERLLREGEERFRLLVEGVKDHAILRLDPQGYVRTWNPGAERIHGYTADEVIGQHFACFYLPEDAAAGKPAEDLAIALAEGRWAEEGVRVRKNGERYWASIVITALYNEQGELRGFAMITRDVTQRRMAEDAVRRTAAELARSNAELEQFAYVASHDLQEPLRAIAGYCQLLQRRYTGRLDSDADEFIAFAVDGATRMQRLIEDLLCYSRVGTRGKVFEPTDCSAVFEQALVNLKTAIAESGAEITRTELPTVPADRSQLEQLFQNLLSNAIKFRHTDPPRVHVAAQADGDHWVFSVADNGIGIEARFADRIFAIFQRLHTRREYPGTGIGLAICKKIVERHGGRIWMRSSPGQGTTFYFTLPMKETHHEC